MLSHASLRHLNCEPGARRRRLRLKALTCGFAGLLLCLAGVPLTAETPTTPFTEKDRQYWAFQQVKRPSVPEVPAKEWVRNPVDAFIARRLQEKGIEPGPQADKVTLLRRVTFDLIGLPPTPEEVKAFLADDSSDAFEKVVERLLASPRYGERWARHWLDVARYAESDGFRADETRPNMWRYRDYVIQSFNDDKPYERFVREQIAGDELWPDDPQAVVATGFNRLYPDEWNARNLMQRRQEILQDITDAVGSAFLGLTYGCAKCHDHKFDPILQKDYYRLQAFFAHTANDDHVPLWTQDQIEAQKRKSAAWLEATAEIRAEIDALMEEGRQAMTEGEFFKFPDLVKDAVAKDPQDRTPYEQQMAHRAKIISEPSDLLALNGIKGDKKKRLRELQEQLREFDHLYHAEVPIGVAMRDLGPQAPATHVLAVGNFANPQEEVQPGFLSILDPNPAKITPPKNLNSTGRRTALANWLADAHNPLTARVMVNRLWHWHFGRGIVATPGDFGRMGERPTHPELLDWLADEFVRSGWSIKHMHRLMVTSSTYRQRSRFREEAAKADPMNRLLWRFHPQRVEAEAVRDAGLLVSGLLNPAMGGPSVFPELPVGMPEPAGGWDVPEDPAERNRRSVYVFVRRATPYPFMKEFDMPDTHESCSRRNQTVTAPQALALLNNEQTLDWAQAFAGRVLKAAGDDRQRQIAAAYRLAYSREPRPWEKDRVLTFLENQRSTIEERRSRGEAIAEPLPPSPGAADAAEAAALVDLCLALLNSNEFAYRY